MNFESKAIHSGEPSPSIEGAVSMPLFHSSTYGTAGPEHGKPLRYTRLGNTPNQLCVEEKIAALEGGEGAVVLSSGMAAITTTLLAHVPLGAHVLAQNCLYGASIAFFQDTFGKLGRRASFFDLEDPQSLSQGLCPETRAIYLESVSNPLLRIPDLRGIVSFAKKHGLMTIIDNTFPSPFNLNPLALGFDLVLHSATKYLNGHSDIVGGAVVGRKHLIEPIRKLMTILGGSMDANSCFLLSRGIKTLGVRVRWQNESALALAKVLEKLPRVKNLSYPGLAAHPDHLRAKEYLRGFGGMLSFRFDGSAEETDAFLNRLHFAANAPSLGGVETLVTRPALTSHSYLSVEARLRAGIHDNLVRVSMGLESPEDLIEDFQAALS